MGQQRRLIIYFFGAILLLNFTYLLWPKSETREEFPIRHWLHRRERVHDEQMEKRRQLVSDIEDFPSKRQEWSILPHPYFIHEPTWICPYAERVGRLGDGGKWICGLRLMKAPCVIYSFGSEGETSFESDASFLSPCEIHIFDPTLDAPPKNIPPRTFYHKYGISDKTGTAVILGRNVKVFTLQDIMHDLGHTYIDVFKIDVEKSEWRIFKQLASTKFYPFGQISIEMHEDPPNSLLDDLIYFFEVLDKRGFRLFYRESNPFCDCAMEYSFIHTKADERLMALAKDGALTMPFLSRMN